MGARCFGRSKRALIFDIGMPGGDGHTVARRLRDNVKTCNVPIIALTARTAGSDRIKAKENGVVKYFTKPTNQPCGGKSRAFQRARASRALASSQAWKISSLPAKALGDLTDNYSRLCPIHREQT
ncbi:MAG: response regulator transcription factor [Acidobacteria bacterium]|nr:MAG: response regulator transcription factor [Acidobacteriota bacterium]